MMHRAGDKKGLRGTFILDRKVRVGRLAIASGTTHPPTFRRLNEMITSLNETGRDDILRAIRDRKLKPLAVYDAFRVNELHRLPLGEMIQPLKETLEAWLATVQCSEAHKAAHRTMVNKMTMRGKGTVADLTGRLVLYGVECYKGKTPAQFNRVRASALAFVRDTLKRSHRLYGEIRDTPPMKEVRSPEKHPQSIEQLKGVAERLTDRRDQNALWAMALSGMGPKEYYVDGFQVLADRVMIGGVKRKGRKRSVPRVRVGLFMVAASASDVGVTREKRRFGERLKGLGLRPYDLRRTYANMLEAAGIPRTRRMLYMGHGKRDVTDLYEHHEVTAFLGEDAERLERYLAATEKKTLELVK